ncbi:MAG: GntR family transcriptional regulator [Longimicrobiales bacterium]
MKKPKPAGQPRREVRDGSAAGAHRERPADIPHIGSRDSGRPSSVQGRITRQTVTDLALVALRDKILHGEYEEGEPLRQDALAADLGVSRIPVREALRQLEAEGLVSFSPHSGAVVSSLSLAEIEELFAIRGLLESEVLRQAIPQLTNEDLDRADAALEAYEAAFERHDVAQWGALNWRFHSTLLSAANRPLTLGVLGNLHNQSDRYMRMQLALTRGEVRAIGEHRAIAAAVRRRDIETAVALLRHHIVSAGESLIEFLRVQRTPAISARGSERRAK